MSKFKVKRNKTNKKFTYWLLELFVIVIMIVYVVVTYRTCYVTNNDCYFNSIRPMQEVLEEISESNVPLTEDEIVELVEAELQVESKWQHFGYALGFYDKEGSQLSYYADEKYGLHQEAYEQLQIMPNQWIDGEGIYASDYATHNREYYSYLDTYHLGAAVVNNGVYFKLVMLYNPVKMILCEEFFWYKLIPFLLLCQIGALVVILCHWMIRGKREKYEKMRNTFINAMAHEMKTPAAVIRNSAECIQGNIAPEKNPYYLEMIINESERMNELLSKMFLYTRTSDGIYALDKEAYSLRDSVDSICESHELAIEFRGLTVEIQEENAEEVMVDKALIDVVLGNMISNAVKYAKENGKIVITLSKKGCSVYNDGQRLTAEQTERIWEPLYKVDESRTDQDGSSGMGLAICKNILELHGARYGVENQEAGVRFFFEL